MSARQRRRAGTIACVFPPCHARIRLVTHRLDPRDVSKTALVIPIHEVEGPGSWFGRCPASQFAMPILSPTAKQVLVDAQRQYVRRFVERINNIVAAAPGEPPESTAMPNLDRPERPEDDYFPPRPADEENR